MALSKNTITIFVEEIFELFEKNGFHEYAGEKISQVEHMLQAAQLAEKQNEEEEIVLAALFHDIGHLIIPEAEEEKMGNYGTIDHELIGSRYILGKGFSSKIASLIAGHVKTKRYLVFKDNHYKNSLSDASIRTLNYQGGPMDETEAHEFENDPLYNFHIKMRQWDDQAKVVDLETKSLAHYKDMALKVLYSSQVKDLPQT